jgi:hypothetical protein
MEYFDLFGGLFVAFVFFFGGGLCFLFFRPFPFMLGGHDDLVAACLAAATGFQNWALEPDRGFLERLRRDIAMNDMKWLINLTV